jgi:endonuclease/exonuclease/phosphatase family metal-dependent hydrolase
MAFVAAVLVVVSGCATVPLDTFQPAPPAALRVVTYNVRFDAIADTEERVHSIVDAIARMDADIVCLQEAYSIDGYVLLDQGRLATALRAELPEYVLLSAEGVARWASGTPILYRRDRFFAVEHGVRWFSHTPNIPDSVSFGNTIPRHMVWSLMYDAHGGAHFLLVNVHLDALVDDVNRYAAGRVREFSDHHNATPQILCGDWNASPTSDVLEHFSDTHQRASADRDAPTFTRLPIRIDHILVSHHLAILNAGVLDVGAGLSDHRPVFADLLLDDRSFNEDGGSR